MFLPGLQLVSCGHRVNGVRADTFRGLPLSRSSLSACVPLSEREVRFRTGFKCQHSTWGCQCLGSSLQ